MPRQDLEISVAEAPRRGHCLLERGVGGGEVAGAELLLALRHQQIAAHHTVDAGVVQYAPRAGEPPRSLGAISLIHELHAEPERAARRPGRVLLCEEVLVRAGELRDALDVLPGQYRGEAPALTVFRF